MLVPSKDKREKERDRDREREIEILQQKFRIESCLQSGPFAGTKERRFQEGSFMSRTDLVAQCTNNIVSTEYLLAFWKCRILTGARQRVPR
jgi:hypothetical protein